MLRRFFHHYKREFGGTQQQLIYLYLSRGKSIDEIQELLKCPRPSIRRCRQEFYSLKREEVLECK